MSSVGTLHFHSQQTHLSGILEIRLSVPLIRILSTALKWAKSAASEKHLALARNYRGDLISTFIFSF